MKTRMRALFFLEFRKYWIASKKGVFYFYSKQERWIKIPNSRKIAKILILEAVSIPRKQWPKHQRLCPFPRCLLKWHFQSLPENLEKPSALKHQQLFGDSNKAPSQPLMPLSYIAENEKIESLFKRIIQCTQIRPHALNFSFMVNRRICIKDENNSAFWLIILPADKKIS